MSAEQLNLEDGYGRRLHWSIFAGQVNVVSIVEKIGDAVVLNNSQAHLLMLWLQEHLK